MLAAERGRAARAAGGRYRRGQDAGRVPADAGRFLPVAAAGAPPPEGLHTLYVSPLKALAHDVQRNLLTPVEEMGLPIRIETRSGDTPSDRKERQRARPPHVLLTTPESLSLLLSYPDSLELFAGLKRVVIDEVHAFATGKRGDLLALALARLQAIAPENAARGAVGHGRRSRGVSRLAGAVGRYRSVRAGRGRAGRAGRGRDPAARRGARAVGRPRRDLGDPAALRADHARNRTTLVFTNTRFLAEYIFQQLWDANEDKLPIGIHHGSLSQGGAAQGRRRDGAGRVARAGLPPPASISGSTGATSTAWCRWARPRARRGCCSGSAAPTTGSTSPAGRSWCPATASNFSRRQAAKDAVDRGPARRRGLPPRRARRARPARHGLRLRRRRSTRRRCWPRCARPGLCLARRGDLARVLDFVATGGYALEAYDKFKRIVARGKRRHVAADPSRARRAPPHERRDHRRFRDARGPLPQRPLAGQGRGGVRRHRCSPGDTFRFAGMDLEVEAITRPRADRARGEAGRPTIPSYMGLRLPLTTHLADRVRAMLVDRAGWGALSRRRARMARGAGLALAAARARTACWSRASRTRSAQYTVYYTFDGLEREPVARAC